MSKIFFLIIVAVVGCILLEGILSEIVGSILKPNLLIVLIVLANLFRGFKFSLWIAILGGLFKDSFSIHLFGLNIFSFLLCIYVATILKIYIYRVGSNASCLLMIALISFLNAIIQYFFYAMSSSVGLKEAWVHIIVPEILTNILMAFILLEKYKKCVLKLFAI